MSALESWRLKPEHTADRVEGGRIRLCGFTYPIASVVDDPDGWVWHMLRLLAEPQSPGDLADQVTGLYGHVSRQTVLEAVSALAEAGHLEDMASPVPPGITPETQERYSRAAAYYRWVNSRPRGSAWEPQAALQGSSVTIIGMGGTGNAAASLLVASGVGTVHLIDPDQVELSNLSRQTLFTEDDLGCPKAEVAAARLRRLNSGIAITSSQLRVTSPADAAAAAAGCDVLVLAADEPPALRSWVNAGCIESGTPWVDSGYHGPLVQVGTYVPGAGTACWECLHRAWREEIDSERTYPRDTPGYNVAMTRAVGAVPASVSGSMAAHAAISLLTGVPEPAPGSASVVNLLDLAGSYAADSPPLSDCPACRRGPAATAARAAAAR